NRWIGFSCLFFHKGGKADPPLHPLKSGFCEDWRKSPKKWIQPSPLSKRNNFVSGILFIRATSATGHNFYLFSHFAKFEL
ncbi:MAG TPA: hypothetical protein VGD40_05275, partial [Chryseosolibacter sp.]